MLVFQPERSRVVREEHPLNMAPMSVTLLVSQLERSPTEVRLEHASNMLFMSVTLLVFQPERSRVVREEQPLNIRYAPVRLEVSNLVRSIDVSLSQRSNQDAVETGAIPSSTTVEDVMFDW